MSYSVLLAVLLVVAVVALGVACWAAGRAVGLSQLMDEEARRRLVKALDGIRQTLTEMHARHQQQHQQQVNREVDNGERQ